MLMRNVAGRPVQDRLAHLVGGVSLEPASGPADRAARTAVLLDAAGALADHAEPWLLAAETMGRQATSLLAGLHDRPLDADARDLVGRLHTRATIFGLDVDDDRRTADRLACFTAGSHHTRLQLLLPLLHVPVELLAAQAFPSVHDRLLRTAPAAA